MITEQKVPPETLGFVPREISPIAGLDDLRKSIKTKGIQTPLLVAMTPTGDLRVIDGLRRLRVALELGLKRVPVICVDTYLEIFKHLPDPEAGECQVPIKKRWRDLYYVWQEIRPFAVRWQSEELAKSMTGWQFRGGKHGTAVPAWAAATAMKLGLPKSGYQWVYQAARIMRFEKEQPDSFLVRSVIDRLNRGVVSPPGAAQHLQLRKIEAGSSNVREEAALLNSAISLAEGWIHSLVPLGLSGVSDKHDPELVQGWASSLRQIRRELTPVIRALEGNKK